MKRKKKPNIKSSQYSWKRCDSNEAVSTIGPKAWDMVRLMQKVVHQKLVIVPDQTLGHHCQKKTKGQGETKGPLSISYHLNKLDVYMRHPYSSKLNLEAFFPFLSFQFFFSISLIRSCMKDNISKLTATS